MARRGRRPSGYMSGLEERFASILKSKKVRFEYEKLRIKYIQPEVGRNYLVDFLIPRNKKLIVECKGLFTAADRKKMLLVKEQNPDKIIVMVFGRPLNTLTKKSKTTYAAWCDKNGIVWVGINELEEKLPCLLSLSKGKDGVCTTLPPKKRKKSPVS